MTEELIDRLRAMYVANGTNYVQAAADKLEAQAERIAYLVADRNLEKKMRKDADEYAETLRDQLAEIEKAEPVGHISNQDTHDGRELIKIFANGAGRSLPRGKHLLFTSPMPPQIIGLQDVHDAITADPTLADCAQDVTELADALESIALAGMSGSGQESEEAMTEWHARQAWKFISIAAKAISKYKGAK